MAEPSRKINKGQHISNFAVVTPDALPALEKNEDPLIFWSSNQERPFLFDLSEFAKGKTVADVRAGKYRWKGDFRGRPELIAELLPAIKYLYGHHRATSLATLLDNLRFWWRVFEEAESLATAGRYEIIPVQSIADLQILHHQIARRRGCVQSAYNQFIRITNFIRSQKGLPLLYWPSIETQVAPSEVPETWEIERVRFALKRRWFDTLIHWKNSDMVLPDLWAWKQLPYTERSIHTHKIYRAVIELTGHPLPSLLQICEAIALKHPPIWMQPLSTSISALYPTEESVRVAFILCLIYSGWNVTTLLNLDVEDRFVEVHPTNPDYHVVYGFKQRGKSVHQCIGRNKRSDAPGTILRELVEHNRPLRKLVRKELAEVESQLADGAATNNELNDLLNQRNKLLVRLRSPWLYVDTKSNTVCHLTSRNVNANTNGATYLRNIINIINPKQPPNKRIRESISLSDLRDCYVGFAYEFSNYNVLTAQIAAGHKRVGTTQTYLRHRQWKAHSAKMIHTFQTAMFREIDESKSVDPTVLRAYIEWNGVTDEERARLTMYRKNRSRIGVGCKDPNNPPSSIAPKHMRGGCRIQRCMLCHENAILLPDSYEGIAMRVAELEFLRDNISITTWGNSEFTRELENAEFALELYASEIVQERLIYWRKEIQAGHHKPILSDGTY